MRTVAAILFVTGIPWALIAWIGIFGGPAAMVEEWRAGRVGDVLSLLIFWPIFAAHVCLGYYIWMRWFSIARVGDRSSRRFWLIAAAHHLVWIAWASTGFWYEPNPALYAFMMYVIVVVAACVTAAARTKPKQKISA